MKIEIEEMKFGSQVVLKDVSLELSKQGCYSLIGKNGLGKTTTFKIISGVINDYTGRIILEENEKITSLIDGYGYISQYTGKEFAEYFLNSSEKENFKKYADLFNTTAYLDKKIKKCSLGMQKKLFLSICLARDANIVLLDEPYNGLDDLAKKTLLDIIVEEKKNRLFIVTTHDFNALSSFSDKVLFIQNKQIVTKELLNDIYSIEFISIDDLERFIDECEVAYIIKKDRRLYYLIRNKDELVKLKSTLVSYDITHFGKEEFNYDLYQ